MKVGASLLQFYIIEQLGEECGCRVGVIQPKADHLPHYNFAVRNTVCFAGKIHLWRDLPLADNLGRKLLNECAQGMVHCLGAKLRQKPLVCLVEDLRILLLLIQSNHLQIDIVDQSQGIHLPRHDRRTRERMAGPDALLVNPLHKHPRVVEVSQHQLTVIGHLTFTQAVTV